MSDQEQTKIFANNLKYYVNKSGKMQKEIAKDLNVPVQTFNSWCKGVCIPRMDKVQQLADYFKIGKSDLLDETTTNVDMVMLRSALEALAKSHKNDHDIIYDYLVQYGDNDRLKVLIELARKSDPADVDMAIELLQRLKKD